MATETYVLRFPDGAIQVVNPDPGPDTAVASLDTYWSNRLTGRRDIRRRLAGVPSRVLLEIAELDPLPRWARNEIRALGRAGGNAGHAVQLAGPDRTETRFGRTSATHHYFGRAGTSVREIDVEAYCNPQRPGHAEAAALVDSMPADLRPRMDDLIADWRPAPDTDVLAVALGVYDRLAGAVSQGHRLYPNSLGGPFEHDRAIHAAFDRESPQLEWLTRHAGSAEGLAGEAVAVVERLARALTAPHQAYPNSLGGGATHDGQIHRALVREQAAVGVIRRQAGPELTQ